MHISIVDLDTRRSTQSHSFVKFMYILSYDCHKYKNTPGGVFCRAWFFYLPAMLRPSTRTVGLPKVVMPKGWGILPLSAMAVMFFSRS